MKAWLFDVDGVLTNIFTKKVEHPQLIKQLCKKLENNEPVGIITGRKISTTLEQVIHPIKKNIKDTHKLKFLHAEGEFGAVEISFDDGTEKQTLDESFKLPDNLTERGKKIIETYKSIVFYDKKESFYTAEMNHGGSHDEFKKVQLEISKKLQELVESLNLSDSIEVHQDTIAVNVKMKKLNKHHATHNLLNWLKKNNINPDLFLVFGDSESDFQIGQELHDQNKKFKFIYTGEKEIKEKPFEVIKVGKFDSGTLEYLTSN